MTFGHRGWFTSPAVVNCFHEGGKQTRWRAEATLRRATYGQGCHRLARRPPQDALVFNGGGTALPGRSRSRGERPALKSCAPQMPQIPRALFTRVARNIEK
jgi:hypothetical protein